MGRLLKLPFVRSLANPPCCVGSAALRCFRTVSWIETFSWVFSNLKCPVLVVVKCLYFFSILRNIWLERALWFYFKQHKSSIFRCFDSLKNKYSYFHYSFPPFFFFFLTYFSWNSQSFKITDESESAFFALLGGVACPGGSGSSLAVPHPALTVMLLLTSMGPRHNQLSGNGKLSLVLCLKAKKCLNCSHK